MEFSNPDWGSVALTSKDIEDMTNVKIDCTADITIHDVTKERWEREQAHLKKRMFLEDVDDWSRHHITPDNTEQFPFMKPLQFIGGVDISFVKGDNVNACAAFVVLNFPELEVIYKDLSMVQLTAPYIPGFLAFREADFLLQKIRKLKDFRPEIMPQVILVDGNGILHPRGFGLACHLGVLADISMIGVAKNLFCVDGIKRDEEHQKKIDCLKKAGDTFSIVGQSGTHYGVAYRSCEETTNPIYLSPGHKISLETAIWVTKKCVKHRIPEPTRQADLLSREYLRDNWPPGGADIKRKQKKKRKQNREQEADDHSFPGIKVEAVSSDDDQEHYGIDLWDEAF